MERYFIVKISVSRFQDDGSQKMVNEMYLIDALSFTEAETRITEEIRKQTSGDLVITDISRSKYSELLLHATVSKKFYRVKTNFVTLSEKTGKEKKTAYYYLVQANEIDEAKESFEKFMKGTISDYEIEGISETKINEVFIFDVNKA
jgi:PBP1b-binding outer membrane lipoprotein LpoB